MFSGVQVPARQEVAPVGSNRSGGGGNNVVGAFDGKGRVSGSASMQAGTRVNAEQAPESSMRKPILLHPGEGRRRGSAKPRSGRKQGRSDKHQRFRRGSGAGMQAKDNHVTTGYPKTMKAWDLQPDAREGRSGPGRETERPVVPQSAIRRKKPGNAGRGKGPWFKRDARRSENRRLA